MVDTKLIDEIKTKIVGKNIFVTGGTGFFGKSLLFFAQKYFSDIEFNLTILSRQPDVFLLNYPQFKHSKLNFIQGDIENFVFPEGSFDYVLHFATPADATLNLQDPLQMIKIILNGMNRVLEFSKNKNIKGFLFASSGAVYGQQPPNLTHVDESYLGSPNLQDRGSAYGEAKRMAELIGHEFARKNEFNYNVARCFAFTGPFLNRTGTFAIGNFINSCINNQDIQINSDGSSIRSYLFSEDLIVWLLKILFSEENNNTFNVGSDQEISILDLANKVKNILAPHLKVLVQQKNKTAANVHRYVPNISKAQQKLNLQVWTSLDEAIKLSAKDL